jgi:hypothetical protein
VALRPRLSPGVPLSRDELLMYGRVQEVSSGWDRLPGRQPAERGPGDPELPKLLARQRVHGQASVRREKLPRRHAPAGLAPLDEQLLERRHVGGVADWLIVR